MVDGDVPAVGLMIEACLKTLPGAVKGERGLTEDHIRSPLTVLQLLYPIFRILQAEASIFSTIVAMSIDVQDLLA